MPIASLRSRRAFQFAAGGVLIAALCSGCAAAGGGTTPGSSASSGSSTTAQSGSGGSVKAECHDQNNNGVSGSTKADELKLGKIWDQDATDAPAAIRAKVVIVDQAYDKAINGDNSGLKSAEFLQALGAVSTWVTKNCD